MIRVNQINNNRCRIRLNINLDRGENHRRDGLTFLISFFVNPLSYSFFTIFEGTLSLSSSLPDLSSSMRR